MILYGEQTKVSRALVVMMDICVFQRLNFSFYSGVSADLSPQFSSFILHKLVN